MSYLPILYSFRRCPYAMRARMALLASRVGYEHREILLRDKPAAMLAASAKGTVPVLALPNGCVIDESIDIMHWALAQADPEDWRVRSDATLITQFDGAFKHHLDRYKYAGRYDADPATHRAAGLAMLDELDVRLADQPYLSGERRGLSDIATFPFVRQFRGVDSAWFDGQPIAAVHRWLAALVGSELFARAMVKVAVWDAHGTSA